MTQHIGHDHLVGYRFHITDIDARTHTVAIRYDETAWLPGVTMTEQFAWTEFLQHLMEGRFEICRPAI